MQLKAAAEELEHAFEPAHRPTMDEFGEEVGEEFFDSGDPLFPPPPRACTPLPIRLQVVHTG